MIDALMRYADTTKSLKNILRQIKDIPRALSRLQATLSKLDGRKDFALITDSIANLFLLRDALVSVRLDAKPHNKGSAAACSDYPAGQLAYNMQASPISYPGVSAPSSHRNGLPRATPFPVVHRAVACIGDSLAQCAAVIPMPVSAILLKKLS